MNPKLSDFKMMFVMLSVFAGLAIGLWKATGIIFYLYNFSIIGISLALGLGLWPLFPRDKKPWARRLSQLLVGGYMFFGLGLGLIALGFGMVLPENMQIEGFWLLLFAGVFQAAVLHYFIAKIIGPAVFNRAWCGWACWTAAVLDLLPWKTSSGRLPGRWGHLRYLHFVLAFALTAGLVFLFGYGLDSYHGIARYGSTMPMPMKEYQGMFQIPEIWWFLTGNFLYFGSGILLAYILKDNRAFCKYLCPIVAFLKPAAGISLTRVGPKNDKCISCGLCNRNCPMDIEVMRYVKEGKKVLSTECILCLTCTSVCPREVLGVTMGGSLSTKGYLRDRIAPPQAGSSFDA